MMAAKRVSGSRRTVAMLRSKTVTCVIAAIAMDVTRAMVIGIDGAIAVMGAIGAISTLTSTSVHSPMVDY
jgi:hypothetical protein